MAQIFNIIFSQVACAGTNSWCFVVCSYIHCPVSETLHIHFPSYSWGYMKNRCRWFEGVLFLRLLFSVWGVPAPYYGKNNFSPSILPPLHSPALVMLGRWHMAVYLSHSGLSFPISFTIVSTLWMADQHFYLSAGCREPPAETIQD